MVDWKELGAKAARAVWGAVFKKDLKYVQIEPDRAELEHIVRGKVLNADWHAYRGGYRDELHKLGLLEELAKKGISLEAARRKYERCECGAMLVHVRAGTANGLLCPECDRDHLVELTERAPAACEPMEDR